MRTAAVSSKPPYQDDEHAGARTRTAAVSSKPPYQDDEHAELLCTWREAVKAADYVLEHFGDRSRDRGIWVWYCRRIGLGTFLDIADEVISSTRQGELRWPTRAFHRHLQEALPKAPLTLSLQRGNPLTLSLQRGNPLTLSLQRGKGGAA